MLDEPSGERSAWFEIEHYGCSPCIARAGAGKGADCDSAKICAASCFGGGGRADNVGLRACVDRHCATPPELELLYPQIAKALAE